MCVTNTFMSTLWGESARVVSVYTSSCMHNDSTLDTSPTATLSTTGTAIADIAADTFTLVVGIMHNPSDFMGDHRSSTTRLDSLERNLNIFGGHEVRARKIRSSAETTSSMLPGLMIEAGTGSLASVLRSIESAGCWIAETGWRVSSSNPELEPLLVAAVADARREALLAAKALRCTIGRITNVAVQPSSVESLLSRTRFSLHLAPPLVTITSAVTVSWEMSPLH